MTKPFTYNYHNITVLEDFEPFRENTLAIKAVYLIEKDKDKSKIYFTDSGVTFKNWVVDYDFEKIAHEAIANLIDGDFNFNYDYYF